MQQIPAVNSWLAAVEPSPIAETKRWVLPKGWPMKGKKPHAVAAIEALEEAGLLGKIGKKPIHLLLSEFFSLLFLKEFECPFFKFRGLPVPLHFDRDAFEHDNSRN